MFLQKIEHGVGFPGNGITSDCEPPSECIGNWTQVLWKNSRVLLTLAESSLQLSFVFGLREIYTGVCLGPIWHTGVSLSDLCNYLQEPWVMWTRGQCLEKVSWVLSETISSCSVDLCFCNCWTNTKLFPCQTLASSVCEFLSGLGLPSLWFWQLYLDWVDYALYVSGDHQSSWAYKDG